MDKLENLIEEKYFLQNNGIDTLQIHFLSTKNGNIRLMASC